jgi:hypothetical protein
MAVVTADGSAAMDPSLRGSVPAWTTGPAAADRSPPTVRPGRAVRSWPLLVLAAPAAAEVWSGWVGIAQKTGFGLVSPLPGIWPSLHLDTAITLPVGVEAYAAFALRAWLASERTVSARTRRFAKWSAIFSFVLGMAGQVAYHLLAQASAPQAPWPVTTIVSCLPVMVLAMGTTLAHMLRADATERPPDNSAGGPAAPPSLAGRSRPGSDNATGCDPRTESDPLARSRMSPHRDHSATRRTSRSDPQVAQQQLDHARLIGHKLAAAGKPVSRRALRSNGVKGSNEALNALARKIDAELVLRIVRH